MWLSPTPDSIFQCVCLGPCLKDTDHATMKSTHITVKEFILTLQPSDHFLYFALSFASTIFLLTSCLSFNKIKVFPLVMIHLQCDDQEMTLCYSCIVISTYMEKLSSIRGDYLLRLRTILSSTFLFQQFFFILQFSCIVLFVVLISLSLSYISPSRQSKRKKATRDSFFDLFVAILLVSLCAC